MARRAGSRAKGEMDALSGQGGADHRGGERHRPRHRRHHGARGRARRRRRQQSRSGSIATVAELREAGGRAHRRLCNALDAADVDATVASVAAGIRPDRHPGQRGRRQHDHRRIRRAGRGAELRRLAEADRLQPVRHVPVHPCGGAGDEAAAAAARSSTWPRSPAAASACRQLSAYAAAKGGIIAFTRKLAFELGPYGINDQRDRAEPHLDRAHPAALGAASPEDQQAEIERTPLRRVAEAADQAKVICFLASDDADFVTGVTIDVTGGN